MQHYPPAATTTPQPMGTAIVSTSPGIITLSIQQRRAHPPFLVSISARALPKQNNGSCRRHRMQADGRTTTITPISTTLTHGRITGLFAQLVGESRAGRAARNRPPHRQVGRPAPPSPPLRSPPRRARNRSLHRASAHCATRKARRRRPNRGARWPDHHFFAARAAARQNVHAVRAAAQKRQTDVRPGRRTVFHQLGEFDGSEMGRVLVHAPAAGLLLHLRAPKR